MEIKRLLSVFLFCPLFMCYNNDFVTYDILFYYPLYTHIYRKKEKKRYTSM